MHNHREKPNKTTTLREAPGDGDRPTNERESLAQLLGKLLAAAWLRKTRAERGSNGGEQRG